MCQHLEADIDQFAFIARTVARADRRRLNLFSTMTVVIARHDTPADLYRLTH